MAACNNSPPDFMRGDGGVSEMDADAMPNADLGAADMMALDMPLLDMLAEIPDMPAFDMGTPDMAMRTAIDTECPIAWAELGASIPSECSNRGVTTVALPLQTHAHALGVEASGLVTILYNELEFADIGRIGTVFFDQDDPDAVTVGNASVEPEAAFGDVPGRSIAVAREDPDIFHVAYWYVSDFGNEVRYHTLRNDVLSPSTTVAFGVGNQGVVDIALDSDRRVAILWHDDDAGMTRVSRQGADGTLGSPVTLRSTGDPRLEGAGAVALATDGLRGVHAAYQWSISLAASAPSYSFHRTEWTTSRTLDNRLIDDRTSGIGIDMALVGDEVVVAYLDWANGSGEIRLARFFGSAMPEIRVYMQGLRIQQRPGTHPLKLASDETGALHLLVAGASLGSPQTTLEYHRQSRVSGTLEWIVDVVARIDAAPESVHVDMKLGPDRRPHISYWDPTQGVVRYATIRP